MVNNEQLDPEKAQSFWTRLKVRYHLSIVNKDKLVEVYALDISRGRLLVWVGGISLVVFVATVALIALTPLKNYLPGLESEEMKERWIKTTKELLKLQEAVKGQVDYVLLTDSILQDFGIVPDSINVMELEKKIEQNVGQPLLPDQYITLAEHVVKNDLSYYHFFSPINGLVSKEFKLDEGHYGIDIVTEKNEAVKATLEGKVIISAWTAETGHVIVIQHAGDLVSMYKHNSQLFKKEGEVVEAGEVIAIVGNSGEFTTGPHLHFELWYKGSPINPAEVIKFD